MKNVSITIKTNVNKDGTMIEKTFKAYPFTITHKEKEIVFYIVNDSTNDKKKSYTVYTDNGIAVTAWHKTIAAAELDVFLKFKELENSKIYTYESLKEAHATRYQTSLVVHK